MLSVHALKLPRKISLLNRVLMTHWQIKDDLIRRDQADLVSRSLTTIGSQGCLVFAELCVIDGSVCLVAADSGEVTRLTPPVRDGSAPRPEACVISPDGRRIAYVRHVTSSDGRTWNQIFTVEAQ
jgi:hypothetical protein